jgi:flagellar L-ring protein precursor FlgH
MKMKMKDKGESKMPPTKSVKPKDPSGSFSHAPGTGARLPLLLSALLIFLAACATSQSTPGGPTAALAPATSVAPATMTAPVAPSAGGIAGASGIPGTPAVAGAPGAVPVNPVRLPLPPPSPEAAPGVQTGSLWGHGNNGSLFKDIKATKIGDSITITVSEEARGAKTASTDTDRTKKLNGAFTFAGAGVGPTGVASPAGGAKFGPYEGSFGSSFAGAGSTSRTNSMSAYMTATVVEVLPNGNLVIRGSRWTKVNDEMQQIVVEGVVRPNDVTRNNTVLSQNIADAKIFLVGKGPVAQHQKPGWLLRVLDLFSPF